MESCLRKLKIFKQGFTLAEVLITLVIIGVVAALTISPLVNTYVESSTVSKVKKGLSILGQAKKLAEAQSGSIQSWEVAENYSGESATQLWNYLKPYISVAKDCGLSSNCYQRNGSYLLSGSSWNDYSGSPMYYKFVLADGSIMWFRTNSNYCLSGNDGVNNVCAIFGMIQMVTKNQIQSE